MKRQQSILPLIVMVGLPAQPVGGDLRPVIGIGGLVAVINDVVKS
jgi:hypothetical protein